MLTNLDRIKRNIEELSEFNSTPGEGLTRFSLTKPERNARKYLKKEMEDIGLKVYEDTAGSIFGKMEGRNKNAPSIIIGSHFDSVKHGGNFDGPAGVIMGLEIMRVLKEQGIKPKYPIECVAMIEEEGGRFGSGVFGSRAMAGKISYQELLENKDENIVNILIDNLTFVIKKRKTRSLRVSEISGILNKQDTIHLEYSIIKIQMSNSDVISGEFIKDVDNNNNMKITINDLLVFDLIHNNYNIHTMVNKIIERYKMYLHKNNWKIK